MEVLNPHVASRSANPCASGKARRCCGEAAAGDLENSACLPGTNAAVSCRAKQVSLSISNEPPERSRTIRAELEVHQRDWRAGIAAADLRNLESGPRKGR